MCGSMWIAPTPDINSAATTSSRVARAHLAKGRRLAGDDDVAHHSELAAAAQGVPVDGAHQGLADAAQLVPAVEHAACVHLRAARAPQAVTAYPPG